MARTAQESLVAIGEITRNLFHPLAIRSRKDPCNLDPPSLEINDEENEISNQSRPSDHFNAEEVSRCNRAPMSLQERLPGHPLFPARVESIFEKDPFDRISCDLMPEIVERSSNSGVAPARVVASHQEYQLLDIGFSPRTTWLSVPAAIIFLRDQLSVPTKQSIRRYQGPDFE